jgi:ribosomal-protein-alanine N-acetyltransferase
MMLTTERLSLRPFRPEDRPAVHAYAADPAVVEFMEYGPNTEAETDEFMSEALVPLPGKWLRALVRRSDDAVIGAAQLTVLSDQHLRGELGYVLTRSAWGLGYATEAAAAVLASVRVLEKIGMHREGIMREHYLIRGQWRDRALYAKLSAQS